MRTPFQLEIVTPDRLLFSGKVDMVILRTTEGDLAVLNRMEMTVAPLTVGALRLFNGDEETIAACAGGFVNVEKELVTIITDAAEWAADIDKARAEAARVRAKARVDQPKDKSIDPLRAKIALMRAINRITIADQHKQG